MRDDGCGDEVIDLHFPMSIGDGPGPRQTRAQWEIPASDREQWTLIFRFDKTKPTSNGLENKKIKTLSPEMSCSLAAFRLQRQRIGGVTTGQAPSPFRQTRQQVSGPVLTMAEKRGWWVSSCNFAGSHRPSCCGLLEASRLLPVPIRLLRVSVPRKKGEKPESRGTVGLLTVGVSLVSRFEGGESCHERGP